MCTNNDEDETYNGEAQSAISRQHWVRRKCWTAFYAVTCAVMRYCYRVLRRPRCALQRRRQPVRQHLSIRRCVCVRVCVGVCTNRRLSLVGVWWNREVCIEKARWGGMTNKEMKEKEWWRWRFLDSVSSMTIMRLGHQASSLSLQKSSVFVKTIDLGMDGGKWKVVQINEVVDECRFHRREVLNCLTQFACWLGVWLGFRGQWKRNEMNNGPNGWFFDFSSVCLYDKRPMCFILIWKAHLA